MKQFATGAFHVFQRSFHARAHPQSLFCTEVLPGIVAEFGEPRSKLKSGRFQLTRLYVRRAEYPTETAQAFWKRFHLKYISHHQRGRKLPRIYKVKGAPDRLVQNGYIVICEPNLANRESFSFQSSYEYWIDRFGQTSELASDSPAAREAIRELLNTISANPALLRKIPTSDSRVFEQLVAEVFRGFGYEVELTKSTRDGGKDVIALCRYADGKTEKLLIECKHWSNRVGVDVVRNLIGVAATENELPTGIILATTSRFTSEAPNPSIHPSIAIDLELKDYDEVLQWINRYDAIRFTPDEIAAYLARHQLV